MSGVDDFDEFDPSGLRRLDRPHPPRETANDDIRRKMLNAFDAEVVHHTINDAETDDTQVVVVDLEILRDDEPAADAGFGGQRNLFYRVAVAAAVAILVGIGVVLALSGPDEITPAEQNEIVVEDFCTTTFEGLVDVFGEFERNPNGEFRTRALRNLELLSQGYADLADELAAPLADDVREIGADFLLRAAEVRREMTVGPPVEVKPESMTALIDDLSSAIEQLPGSSSCRIADLQGG